MIVILPDDSHKWRIQLSLIWIEIISERHCRHSAQILDYIRWAGSGTVFSTFQAEAALSILGAWFLVILVTSDIDLYREVWLSFCPMTLTIGEFKYLWFGLKSFQSVIAIHLYSSALCDSIECHFRITSSVRIFSSSHDRPHFVKLSPFIVFQHNARCHNHFYFTMVIFTIL